MKENIPLTFISNLVTERENKENNFTYSQYVVDDTLESFQFYIDVRTQIQHVNESQQVSMGMY